jgi:hypothetical protein
MSNGYDDERYPHLSTLHDDAEDLDGEGSDEEKDSELDPPRPLVELRMQVLFYLNTREI